MEFRFGFFWNEFYLILNFYFSMKASSFCNSRAVDSREHGLRRFEAHKLLEVGCQVYMCQ